MHIALIVWHADETRGGAERYTFIAARELARRGHEVTLLCAESATRPTTFRIERLTPIGLTRTARFHDFARRWQSWRQAHTIDLAHAMLPIPEIEIYDAMAGFETLTLARETLLSQLLLRKRNAFAKIEQAIVSQGTLALSLSERERQSALRVFGCPADRIATRPLTLVDAPALDRTESRRSVLKELCIDDAARLTLFAGDDFVRKNLAAALEAIAPLERVHLLVAGRGDASRSRALLKVLGPRVRLLGSRSDMPRLLAACETLLLPSHHEPFGMVVPEAMCQGCVPIVSANVGAADVIRPRIDGILIDAPSDVAGLTLALHTLADPLKLAEMSSAALSRREEFSLERHFDTLEEIYAHRRVS